MKFIEHILYQKILSYIDAYPEVLYYFEKTLEEKGINVSSSDSREDYEKYPSDSGLKCYEGCEHHNAMIISAFFNNFSPEEVNEYINLGRKGKIARNIIKCLNEDRHNFEEICQMLFDFCKIPVGKIHLPTTITLDIRVNLISRFISSQLSYVSIAKNYINMRDVAEILNNSVGTKVASGVVGGKAAGMLLANRILRPTLETRNEVLDERIEEIDSYYINSSIVNEFIAFNHLEVCHSLKYFDGEDLERERAIISESFMKGRFKDETLEKFRCILEKTEGSPLILRSSSFLEDSVGCSFTGKYDSFFISNIGTPEERLKEFTTALKNVYLSLYSSSALQYRRDKHLLDYNEKMSVLVQKVVGKAYGKYFFPAVAIVGFSRNPYCWNKKIRKEDGMLRMVMGLGTRAVDRVGDDYPRIVSLSVPELRPEVTEKEKIKYSQKYVDVLNLETKKIETIHFIDLVNWIWQNGHNFPANDIVSVENGGVLSRPMFRPDKLELNKCAITFDGLLANKDFSSLMKHIFEKIEKAYNMPVDMEFAYQDGKLYVLQCRSLSQRENIVGNVEIPEAPEEKILFTANKGVFCSVEKSAEYIIYVDKKGYDSLGSNEKKFEVARIIGKLNKELKNKKYILIGPGRWGTNNLDLGVGVKYADINNTNMLIEVAWEKDGATPELSYGTHFFQDLVEADIVSIPLFPDDKGVFFNLKFFEDAENAAKDFIELNKAYENVVKLIDLKKKTREPLKIYLDESTGRGMACFY